MKFRRFVNHVLSLVCHCCLVAFGVLVQIIGVLFISFLSLLFGGHTKGAVEAQNILTVSYLKFMQEFMHEAFKE